MSSFDGWRLASQESCHPFSWLSKIRDEILSWNFRRWVNNIFYIKIDPVEIPIIRPSRKGLVKVAPTCPREGTETNLVCLLFPLVEKHRPSQLPTLLQSTMGVLMWRKHFEIILSKNGIISPFTISIISCPFCKTDPTPSRISRVRPHEPARSPNAKVGEANDFKIQDSHTRDTMILREIRLLG